MNNEGMTIAAVDNRDNQLTILLIILIIITNVKKKK